MRYTRPTGHGTRRCLKGCRLKDDRQLVPLQLTAPPKEAGPYLCSRTSTGPEPPSTLPVETGATPALEPAADCEGLSPCPRQPSSIAFLQGKPRSVACFKFSHFRIFHGYNLILHIVIRLIRVQVLMLYCVVRKYQSVCR